MEFLKIVFGPVLSALVTIYIVNRIKGRSDHVVKRIDDMCSEIRLIADLASDYWKNDEIASDAVLSSKIATRFKLSEQMRYAISKEFNPILSNEVSECSARFFRSLTGDNFGVHNRLKNIQIAKIVQSTVADYIFQIRQIRIDNL